MAIISADEFFQGQPAKVVHSASTTAPSIPKKDERKASYESQQQEKRSGFLSTITGAVKDQGRRAAEAVSSFKSDRPLSEKIGKSLDVVTGAASTVFSPISGALNEVSNRGGLPGKIATKVVEKPFELLGKAGSFVGGKVIEALPLNEENEKNLKQPVEELSALAAQFAGGKVAEVAAPKVKSAIKTTIQSARTNVVSPIKNKALDAAVGTGEIASKLKDEAQTYVARKNVPENFETSVSRVADPLTKYDEFYKQEQKFKGDIKADTALSVVGERTGQAFEKVVNTRREAGKKMADEMKRVGETKTNIEPAFEMIEMELAGNGLKYDGTKKTFSQSRESKMSSQDVDMLNQYVKELNELGATPKAAELDAFMSRVPRELDVYKGKNNVMKTTNGERIIKQHLRTLNSALSERANPEFTNYAKAKADYAALSSFLDEGVGFMGKKTQAGDYAKDASLAKSAVQSVLNNGKKDWLAKLEDLTGYTAIDEAMLAIQAMKDSGNFRGNSLLELLTPKEAPKMSLTPGGIADKTLGVAWEYGKEKFSGTPYEQTKRVIEARTKAGEATVPSQFEMPQSTGSTDPRAGFADFNAPIKFPELPVKEILRKFAPPKAALDEMAKFTEYIHSKKKDPAYEADIRDMAAKFGINPEQSNAQLAKKFTELLDEAKYSETLK